MAIGKLKILHVFQYCYVLFCNLFSGATTLIPTIAEFFLEYILCKPYTRSKNLSSVQPAISLLPEDILVNIIVKLPVKYLLRCRCVCKTWHQIIATPLFSKTHLTYQKASSSCKYFLLLDDDKLCMLLTDSDPLFDRTKDRTLHYTYESFGNDITRKYVNLRIYGVCNGLLCLSDQDYPVYDKTIHLWNPICRKARKLPQLKIWNEDGDNFNRYRASLSFGYYNDDYKVIVIPAVNNTHVVVSIYSLSTDSWNTIYTNFFIDQVFNRDDNLAATQFVDGAAYLMLKSTKVVISFKLSDETIQVIQFPEGFDGIDSAIEAYGGRLSLLGHENNCLTMWILRDKSSSSTSPWENKFSIELKEHNSLEAVYVEFLNDEKYLFRISDFTWNDGKHLHDDFILWNYDGRRRSSNFVESLLLLNEEGVHPSVQPDYVNNWFTPEITPFFRIEKCPNIGWA